LVVPLYIPIVTLGVPGAALLFWQRRRHPGTCPRCGYDLSGLAGGRCPECGAIEPARAE
jgi:hypothetical protein